MALAHPDLAGFLEYQAGPTAVRVTPDGRAYAYTFFTVQNRLAIADVGKDWWK